VTNEPFDARAASADAPQADPGGAELPPQQSSTLDWSAAASTSKYSCPASDPRLHTHLGRFEILHGLGRGSFGTVYCAVDRDLDRQVALKILHAEAVDNEAAVQRFLREARSAAQLRHPHIVAVLEAGQIERTYFIASELISGGTLREAIQARPRWAPAAAAALVAILAEALNHAHARGIVHRDIKPENILLDMAGQPHIADFGLARREEADGLRTHDGSQIGTPAYMSPEQALGEVQRVDGRSDQWSLGVLLYELLTGQRPFTGASLPEMVTAITQHEPARPRLRHADVPRDLETICLKCLEKNPAQRYASCQELLEDLQRWQRHEPILARPVTRAERLVRWCRRKPALSSAVAVALLTLTSAIGLTAYHLAFRTTAARQLDERSQQTKAAESLAQEHRARADAEFLNTQRQTCTSLLTQGLNDCQNGDLDRGLLTLASALPYAERCQATDLEHVLRSNIAAWLSRISSLQQISIQLSFKNSILPLYAARFDAGGQRILASTGFPYLLKAHDGVLIHNSGRTYRSLSGLAWGPGDLTFGVISADGMASCHDARTGEALQTIHASAGKPLVSSVFSRDGRLLLACCGDGVGRLWDLQSGRLRAELPHGERLARAAFSPGGKMAATCGPTGVKLWDTATGKPAGPDLTAVADVVDVQFTEDGCRLLVCGFSAQLYDLQTGSLVGHPVDFSRSPVGWHDEPVVALHWDGHTVAVREKIDNGVQIYDLLTGLRVGQKLNHSARVERIRFSSDGRLLATGSRDGVVRVWSPFTGEAVGQPLRDPEGWITALDVRSDSQRLLTGARSGPIRIWHVAHPTRFEETRLESGPSQLHARFGNDRLVAVQAVRGNTLLEVWNPSTGKSLYRFPVEGRTYESMAISPNRGKLAAAVRRNNSGGAGYEILQWDLKDGKSLIPIPLSESDFVQRVQYSADGLWILVYCLPHKPLLFQSETGKAVQLDLPTGWSVAWFLSPDRLLLENSRGQFQIYSLELRRESGTILQAEDLAGAYTDNSDRSVLAVVSASGTLRVVDVGSGQLKGRPIQLAASILQMAVSFDGATVAVCDQNRRLQFWDVATGHPVGGAMTTGETFLHALDLRFVEQDQRLAVACNDRAIRTFDVPQPIIQSSDELLRDIEFRTGASLESNGNVVMLDRSQWYERRAADVSGVPLERAAASDAQGGPPSVAAARLLHHDSFDDPKSGFRVLQNEQAQSASFYRDGRFVIRSEKRNYALRSSPWIVKDFACRIRGRTLGRPHDYWSFVLTDDTALKNIRLRVDQLANGSMSVRFSGDSVTKTLGPLPTAARPSPHFNELSCVVRDDRLWLYMNGKPVLESFELPETLPPSRIYVGAQTHLAGQAEFEEIHVWDATTISVE
jgi:WD40 repeat protein